MNDSIKREANKLGLSLWPRENVERPYTRKKWAVMKGDTKLAVLASTSVQPFLKGYREAMYRPVALNDVDVLRSAREILESRGQDVENLSSAIWSMTCATVYCGRNGG